MALGADAAAAPADPASDPGGLFARLPLPGGSQRHRTGVRAAGDLRTVAQGSLVAWPREGVGGSLLPVRGSSASRHGAEIADLAQGGNGWPMTKP